MVLLAAFMAIPLLLPRAPALWSVPAAAPLAAAVGAGPAYAAIAGQGTTWGRRAALGAIGFLWVGLAEATLRHPLVFGLAEGQRARSYWVHDGWRALQHGVAPLFASPAIACAGVWALFAVALPLLVRGRRLAADVLAAAVWAGCLYAAMRGVEWLMGPTAAARGVALGAVGAGVLAVAFAAGRRAASGAAYGSGDVP